MTAAAATTVLTVDSFDGLARLKPDWERLHRAAGPDPFRSYAWVLAWLRQFGGDGDWRILVVRRNGRVIGIAPMIVTRHRYRGLPLRKIGFLDRESLDLGRGGILAPDEPEAAIEAVFDALARMRKDWDMAELVGLEEGGVQLPLIERALEARRFGPVRRSAGKTARILPVTTDWEQYLREHGYHFRRRVRNELNKLARLGTVTMREARDRDEVRAQLDRVMPIILGHLGVDERAQLAPEDARAIAFLYELADAMAPAGGIDLRVLEIDGRPVSCLFSLVDGASIFPFLTKYDKTLARMSPGRAVFTKFFEQVMGRGYAEIDFLSDWPYLHRFTDRTRRYLTIRFFHAGPYSQALAFGQERLAPALRRLLRRTEQAET